MIDYFPGTNNITLSYKNGLANNLVAQYSFEENIG
jgi:hypothetical protein